MTKDPVVRTASVTIRDPSLTLRMTGDFWCGFEVGLYRWGSVTLLYFFF